MGVKSSLREFWFWLSHPNPNTPESLEHRAEKIEREFGKDHPYASTLRKLADMKRKGEA